MANIDSRLQAIADSLATLVTLANNHEQRLTALESVHTGAGTASAKQKQAVAPKSVKGTTADKPTKRKGKSAEQTSAKVYDDVAFTFEQDGTNLTVRLAGDGTYLNKAQWLYLYRRICQQNGGKSQDGLISFADKKSYNACVKALKAFKGVLPNAPVAEFIANGWK